MDFTTDPSNPKFKLESPANPNFKPGLHTLTLIAYADLLKTVKATMTVEVEMFCPLFIDDVRSTKADWPVGHVERLNHVKRDYLPQPQPVQYVESPLIDSSGNHFMESTKSDCPFAEPIKHISFYRVEDDNAVINRDQ